MSRSKKKTKIQGMTSADSEKQDKRDANRKFRRKIRQKVSKGEGELPKLREVSNVWSFGKDSKQYNDDISEKSMRK